MKNKIISLITVLIVFTFSCNDDFLQRNALNQLSEGSFWKTEYDAEVGINAIYNTLREYTTAHVNYGLLDDFSDISYYAWSHAMTSGSYTSTGGLFSGAWKMLYKGVQRANTAIDLLDGIEMSEITRNRLKGEALFLRALFYFKLWDLFGGVPLYDIPINYDEATKPRNTSEEVATFIIKDLTDAIGLLPLDYTGVNRGRATKWAALSLRGKTYLYSRIWDKAAEDFNEVITKSGHELHPDFGQVFNFKWKFNKEAIFEVQYIMVEGFGNPCDIYYGNRSMKSQGWQVTMPTSKLVDEYERMDGTPFRWADFAVINGESFDPANDADWQKQHLVNEVFKNRDPRLKQTVMVPWDTILCAGNKRLIYKWPFNSSDPECFAPSNAGWALYLWRKFVHEGEENTLRYDSPNNLPVIRYADVLLMYAEAKNEMSSVPDASVYDAINKVRTRVGLPGIPAGTKDEVRKRIQHERKVEFAGEGIWYSDIRRYKLGIELCNHNILGFNGYHEATRKFAEREYLWPIPQEEIDINPSITQNPGWE